MLRKFIPFATLGIALAFVLGVAQPAEAGRWKLTDTKKRTYFLPDDQVGKDGNRTRIKSVLVKTETLERGHKTGKARESGTPDATEATEEMVGARTRSAKTEGRFLNTYESWPIDTIKVVTTKTPYVDYKVVTYEAATRKTFKNTYRVKETVTWRDPVNGQSYTQAISYIQGPEEEPETGPWEPKEIKTRTGTGTDVKVDREKIASRTETRLLKKVLAGSSAALTAKTTGGAGQAVSGDVAKGSGAARTSSYVQSRAISGAAAARSAGGLNLDPLFEAARQQPDLFDETGQRAWKLTAEGNDLVFTPYSGAGPVRLGRGQLSATGQGGTSITLISFSVNPTRLVGEFSTGAGSPITHELKAQ